MFGPVTIVTPHVLRGGTHTGAGLAVKVWNSVDADEEIAGLLSWGVDAIIPKIGRMWRWSPPLAAGGAEEPIPELRLWDPRRTEAAAVQSSVPEQDLSALLRIPPRAVRL